MQSTGEVIGIAEDPRVAMAKALTGASLVPPRPGEGEAPLALLSIADRDKWGLLDAGRGARPGRLPARGDARDADGARARPGFGVEPVAKLGAEPDAGSASRRSSTLIAGGDVRLVVNTPTPRSGAVRDAAEIRHAAIAEGVLCLTAIETGIAAAEALEPDIVDADRRGPLASPSGSRRPGAPRRLSRGAQRRHATAGRRGGRRPRSRRRSPGPATTA